MLDHPILQRLYVENANLKQQTARQHELPLNHDALPSILQSNNAAHVDEAKISMNPWSWR
jgi:hypothetical protein